MNEKDIKEMIEKNTVIINEKRYVPSKLVDSIGTAKAKKANRQPGDPGTRENPIFKNGHAYVYSSTDRLILWEDYDGLVPVGTGITVNINPETMDAFTLTKDMKPSEQQKAMIQKAGIKPAQATDDCPLLSEKQLSRLRPLEFA